MNNTIKISVKQYSDLHLIKVFLEAFLNAKSSGMKEFWETELKEKINYYNKNYE